MIITITARGHVTIEAGTRTVGMSPYAVTAQQLTAALGTGTHTLKSTDPAWGIAAATLGWR